MPCSSSQSLSTLHQRADANMNTPIDVLFISIGVLVSNSRIALSRSLDLETGCQDSLSSFPIRRQPTHSRRRTTSLHLVRYPPTRGLRT